MTHTKTKQGRRGGFTLTELMISLAMVLLLVLAMTRIFGVTTRAISKGNAVGEATRGIEAVRTSLTADFTGTAGIARPDGGFTDGILPLDRQPSIIITNDVTYAFLNASDRAGDSDGNPRTVDRDNDGKDDGPALSAFQTGRRWFRTDRLSFFTGGKLQSQTNVQPAAGTGFEIGSLTAHEGWVWYGHARVFGGTGDLNFSDNYYQPARGTPQTNKQNYYVADWKLLRNVMLMKPLETPAGESVTVERTVVDDAGRPVVFTPATWDTNNPSYSPSFGLNSDGTPKKNSPANVTPFTFNFPAYLFDSATGTNKLYTYAAQTSQSYATQNSRSDLVGVTADLYRQRLKAVQEADPKMESFNANTYGSNPISWYFEMFATGTGDRFWINPFVVTPIDASELSQATAYLLNGAAQFVVEYAGDFLSQSGNGTVTATLPDGVLDFTVDANNLRRTRWYGLPRDVDGDGSIPGPGANANVLRQSVDVRPLADYVRAVDLPAAVGGGTADVNVGYPFERRLPGIAGNTGPTGRQSIKDYLADFPANGDVNYTVAFGPGDFDGSLLYPAAAPGQFRLLNGEKLGPSLIRVIVEAVDADGKLEEPVSTELVFRVPAE